MALNNIHSCGRESCPPLSVSGSVVHCYLCKVKCFARCFGIDDAIFDAAAPKSIFTNDSNIQFICPKCLQSPNKAAASVPDALANDIKDIQFKLGKVITNQVSYDKKLTNMATDSYFVRDKLGDLFTININTNEACQNIDTNFRAVDRKTVSTFSEVVRGNTISPPIRPQAVKRSRLEPNNHPETPSNTRSKVKNRQTPFAGASNAQPEPIKRPAPLVGTSNAVNGFPIVTVQTVPKPLLTKFDKSIWASRFHPVTTVEQVTDLLMNIANFEDRSQFFCKKLVKRDADLSLLHFISFKIDVNEEHFNRLMDPDIWPKDVHIREFSNERRTEPKLLSADVALLPPSSNLLDLTNSNVAMETEHSDSNEPSTSSAQNSSIETIQSTSSNVNVPKNVDLNNLSIDGVFDQVNRS